MPYTINRLIEDGFAFDGRERQCTNCGAWIYRFRDSIGGIHWLSKTSNAEDSLYQRHDIRVCDAQRVRRKK